MPEAMHSTYAIGDLQGCDQQLAMLLEKIKRQAKTKTQTQSTKFIFVGDIVNRGPQSLHTLQRIHKLGEDAEMVLGNHDLHLLAVAKGIRKAHASDTLGDILNSPHCDVWIDWLRRQPLALHKNHHLIVHAGVLPQWTTQQTLELAREVETCLQGPDWVDFLREMYGNTPRQWDDKLTGTDRLRCIVNGLTRIRFCTKDGVMDLDTKEGINAALPDHMPWFDVPERKTSDTTIVFGHWSTLGLMLRPNLISLDTGCVWGGQLTAVCLEDRSLVQVDCPQQQRPNNL